MNLPTILFFLAPYFAYLIGLVTLAIGISAMIAPGPMSVKFGIKASDLALPYVVAVGIRDVFMGLVVLTVVAMEHWLSLGIVSLCLGMVALTDFAVVQKYGNRKIALVHLAGAIAVIGYGTALLLLHR